MTPAQEAKEYAAKHGFSIGNVVGAKRYFVYRTRNGVSHGDAIAEVGGYPAALNAMKRYVQEQAEPAALEQAHKTGKVGDVNTTNVEIPERATLHKLANYCAMGSLEWYARRPWRIVGPGYFPMAYATRSDALKTVRRRFAGVRFIRIVYMGA